MRNWRKASKKYRITFYPVLYNTKNTFEDENSQKITFRWWKKDSFFHYPFLLVSYGIHGKSNLLDKYGVEEDVDVLGDSGGLQQFTGDKIFDPVEVVRWQEKHCNIGLSLDLPIDASSDEGSKCRYNQLLTIKNTRIAHEARDSNSTLKFYPVFMGRNINELQFMKEGYEKAGVLPADGVSLGSLVSTRVGIFTRLNSVLMFLETLGDVRENIHFLGISGVKILPYLFYIASKEKYDLKNISIDSSSFIKWSNLQVLLNAMVRGNITFGERNSNTSIKIPPCNCPVCSKIYDVKCYSTRGYDILLLHNLWFVIDYVHKLNSFADDVDLLLKFIEEGKGRNTEARLSFVKYIDDVFDKGYEEANKLHNLKLLVTPVSTYSKIL